MFYNLKYILSTFIITLVCFLCEEDDGTGKKSHFFESNDKELLKATENGINDNEEDCWISLNASTHFKIMDDLDERFADARQSYHNDVAPSLDKEMLQAMLESRGAAQRAISKVAGNAAFIPSGLNLGGHSMLRMKESVLFFHRMKLRNDTKFRVQVLVSDLARMRLTARLALHDLHLVGAYERAATYKDPSVLYHVPNYGEIEVLLKNVDYKMEGRLRLLRDTLVIEVVDSDFIIEDDILLTYLNMNETVKPMRLRKKNMDDFLERLKTDFDLWLMDYFNDYFMYYNLGEVDSEFQDYEKAKTLVLNEYADFVVNKIRQRMYDLGLFAVQIPRFTLFSVPNLQINLKNGVIRGLDTMYRRTVATGKKEDDVRYVDFMVGFSNLKVEYKFEATLPTGVPPLVGHLLLTADELTAHLQASMVQNPEAINFKFDFIQQLKPQSLTVEGSANRLIANYKHLLENHIIALMSNSLMHNIKMLSTLARCEPYLYGFAEQDPYTRESAAKSSEKQVQENKLEDNDYVLIKNDSVEIEIPNEISGQNEKLKLVRQEKFSIHKLTEK